MSTTDPTVVPGSESAGTAAPATTDNPVVVKLTSLGVPSDVITKIQALGVVNLEDLTFLGEDDLKGAGMLAIPAKRLLASIKESAATNGKAAATGATLMAASILPKVPDGPSLLAALKAGGVLKVDETAVNSAILAGLCAATQLNEVPSMLLKKIKDFARAQKEQVPPMYRTLRKVLGRRSYGEILSLLQGAEGVTTVPKDDKDYLLEQVLGTVFPALATFQYRLNDFVTEYRKTGLDPLTLVNALGGGMANPLLSVTPPDMGVLHDAAETVIEAINGGFAGDGVIAARALAFDALEIVQVLNDPGLPIVVGAASREHMLRELGIDITSDFERLERSVPQYALAVMRYNTLTPGTNEELAYAGAMNQLGAQIPWETLTKKRAPKRPAGIGGRLERDDDE